MLVAGGPNYCSGDKSPRDLRSNFSSGPPSPPGPPRPTRGHGPSGPHRPRLPGSQSPPSLQPHGSPLPLLTAPTPPTAPAPTVPLPTPVNQCSPPVTPWETPPPSHRPNTAHHTRPDFIQAGHQSHTAHLSGSLQALRPCETPPPCGPSVPSCHPGTARRTRLDRDRATPPPSPVGHRGSPRPMPHVSPVSRPWLEELTPALPQHRSKEPLTLPRPLDPHPAPTARTPPPCLDHQTPHPARTTRPPSPCPGPTARPPTPCPNRQSPLPYPNCWTPHPALTTGPPSPYPNCRAPAPDRRTPPSPCPSTARWTRLDLDLAARGLSGVTPHPITAQSQTCLWQ